MSEGDPSGARIAAACLAAAAAAPTPISVLTAVYMTELGPAVLFLAFFTSLVGFVIAALHLVLALPAYQLFRRWWRLRWWSSALAGFVIGTLPIAVIAGSWNGVGATGVCGAVGGLAFWAVLRGVGRRDHEDLDQTFA